MQGRMVVGTYEIGTFIIPTYKPMIKPEYIFDNSDVWKSIDGGVNWNKINDDFSPYSNDACRDIYRFK